MASQQQLREAITQQIITALETGDVPPWRRPWQFGPNAGFPANVVSRKAYRGINPILLEMATTRHNLTSKWWGTFNHWKSLGGKVMPRPPHVPPGKWGTQIVFWSPIKKTVTNDIGQEEEDRFFIMKTYTVFNVDQVEGDHLDQLRAGHGEMTPPEWSRRLRARRGGHRRHGDHHQARRRQGVLFAVRRLRPGAAEGVLHGVRRVLRDRLPRTRPRHRAPSRLNWSRKEKDHAYALGEFVAEIGACYLARELGVPASENLTNHVAYLANWLKAMKDDPKFIFVASAQASRAADYLLSFSRPQAVEEAGPVAALAG